VRKPPKAIARRVKQQPDSIFVWDFGAVYLGFSELSVRYGFGLEELVSGPLFEVAEEVLKEDGQDILPLGVKFGTVAPDEEPNPGQIASINFSRGHQLEYRAGTRLEEGMFFSSAELSTDMHVDWLEALGRKVAAAKGE
jgi:hypothetical protein